MKTNRLLQPFSRHLFFPMALVLALFPVLSGCSKPADTGVGTKELVRPVKAMRMLPASAEKVREFPGIVKPASEADLAFRVGGPLVAYDIRVGQRVQKGEVMARIDPRDFKIRVQRLSAAIAEAGAELKAMKKGARAEDLARLEAELDAARSRLTEARRDFDRQKNLLAQKAASKARYDKTKTALDAARAGVTVLEQELKKAKAGARAEDIEAAHARIQSLTAELKAAQNALGDTVLKAPFTGYVNHKYVENHETVEAGRPVASLIDLSIFEVKTAVTEEVALHRPDIDAVFCTLDAYPNRPVVAEIKEIGRQTDTANQSFPMTVKLVLSENLAVTPGMAATVRVIFKGDASSDPVFLLPSAAVFADETGQACVWRVDPASMQVKKTPVAAGSPKGDFIQVTNGLAAGDTVATAGARFLWENQKVRILQGSKEVDS